MNNKKLKIVVILMILFSGLILIEMNLSGSGWWCACINENEAEYMCYWLCSSYGGCAVARVRLGSCMCFQGTCFCDWILFCNFDKNFSFLSAQYCGVCGIDMDF